MNKDLYLFSEENLLEQIENSQYELGFYRVKVYTENGLLGNKKTD
jgi:hypothetical protein